MSVEIQDEKLRNYPERVRAKIIQAVKVTSLEALSYARVQLMSGPTGESTISSRSGFLRSSTRAEPPHEAQETIEGGISFGTRYAGVQVGPQGKVTTIRPVKGRFLAIPLPEALTAAGVPRGGPRSGVFGETFIKGGIIYGKQTYAKGARTGQTKGKITPLFLLRTEVKVPARVHPEQIVAWWKPKATAEVTNALQQGGA